MCGIVGYIGDRKASNVLRENLRRLEYRGYDSCGIATLEKEIRILKGTGTIDGVDSKLHWDSLPGNAGIGHTRWATHGKVADNNAHPHLDCKGKIAIVHNGIISNYKELKERLKGHNFKSETDSECLAHLIEEEYRNDIEKAVRNALSKVKGTYALLVLSAYEPDKIICARMESPLLIGIGNKEIFAGSDIASFLQFTNKAIALDDGEYATITKKGWKIANISTGAEVEKEILEIDWTLEEAQKEGYPHFMLKEIYDQPNAVINALSVYPEKIFALAQLINDAERVYIVAAGTSLHAAMVAEYWFSEICEKCVIAVDSSELMNKGVIDGNALVIGVTQSGETYDTLVAMKHAKSKGAKTAAIVNVIGSTATRLADHIILQGSGMEISVCATKTFTAQLVILLRIAIELGKILKKNTKDIDEEIQKLPKYMQDALSLEREIKETVDKYFRVKNYIYIGKGINLPSALEGALKFKEITYNHAEGMSGGMLKHGTISLIDDDMHTIAIVPKDGENRIKIKSNIVEVKSRGGIVIGIVSGEPVEECDANIVMPSCSELLSPIVFAPAYQLLAYYTAVKLGRNVDRPRALAKSVTVE